MLNETKILELRKDFPILSSKVESGNNLVYLDWAATAQKPLSVIQAEVDFYTKYNGSIDRGTHFLVGAATTKFKNARNTLASFINAQESEIVWTKNATEAINLVAYAFLNATCKNLQNSIFYLNKNDEICITKAEHHANIIPWQEVCAKTGAKLTWLELNPDGSIDLDSLSIITHKTKIVSFTHISNVTGFISNVSEIVKKAQSVGALTLLDACQSIAHIPFDVKILDIDFTVFSAHKMYGPTGVGALYAKKDLLPQIPPFITGGGSMVKKVELTYTEYNTGYTNFEAGTQAVAQIIAWEHAIQYLSKIGMQNIAEREQELTQILLDVLQQIDGINILGSNPLKTQNALQQKSALVAFDVANIHPHDVGQILNEYGFALRVGHHCAMPLHKFFNVNASTRASLSFLNTKQEIELLGQALLETKKFFQ